MSDDYHYDGGSVLTIVTALNDGCECNTSHAVAGITPSRCGRRSLTESKTGFAGRAAVETLQSLCCSDGCTHFLVLTTVLTDTGGDLVTLEANGTRLVHRLQTGDSACFVSHKYHSISPVLSGERLSLVVELWQGGIAGLGRS